MASILIVEDEKSSAMLITQALTRAGHTVTAATDGADGIAKVKSLKPDLVIMDMSMPKMNGWQAIRSLKADAATSAIPIIALTGATTAGDRDEAYEAGCDAYENKPIDIPRLIARVKEFVKG
ncbi:MAG: response regulator [Rhodospirillaceae bacterium]|nr:response regulator [Rhodospirillaceae bacterium]